MTLCANRFTDRDRKKIMRRAISVLGYPLKLVEVVGKRKMMAKLSSRTTLPIHYRTVTSCLLL